MIGPALQQAQQAQQAQQGGVPRWRLKAACRGGVSGIEDPGILIFDRAESLPNDRNGLLGTEVGYIPCKYVEIPSINRCMVHMSTLTTFFRSRIQFIMFVHVGT